MSVYNVNGTIVAAKEVCGTRVWDLPGYYLDGIGAVTRAYRADKKIYDAARARRVRAQCKAQKESVST